MLSAGLHEMFSFLCACWKSKFGTAADSYMVTSSTLHAQVPYKYMHMSKISGKTIFVQQDLSQKNFDTNS